MRRVGAVHDPHYDTRHLLFIFLFFLAGALSAQSFLAPSLAPPDVLLWAALPLALAFLLSGSVMGAVLIPVCTLLMGLAIGFSAQEIVRDYSVSTAFDFRALALTTVLVPLFFVIAVRGMALSELLCFSLAKQGRSGRELFAEELLPLLLALLLGLAALYFLWV